MGLFERMVDWFNSPHVFDSGTAALLVGSLLDLRFIVRALTSTTVPLNSEIISTEERIGTFLRSYEVLFSAVAKRPGYYVTELKYFPDWLQKLQLWNLAPAWLSQMGSEQKNDMVRAGAQNVCGAGGLKPSSVPVTDRPLEAELRSIKDSVLEMLRNGSDQLELPAAFVQLLSNTAGLEGPNLDTFLTKNDNFAAGLQVADGGQKLYQEIKRLRADCAQFGVSVTGVKAADLEAALAAAKMALILQHRVRTDSQTKPTQLLSDRNVSALLQEQRRTLIMLDKQDTNVLQSVRDWIVRQNKNVDASGVSYLKRGRPLGEGRKSRADQLFQSANNAHSGPDSAVAKG